MKTKKLPDHGAVIGYDPDTDTSYYGPMSVDGSFYTEELIPAAPSDLKQTGSDEDRFNDLINKFQSFLDNFK